MRVHEWFLSNCFLWSENCRPLRPGEGSGASAICKLSPKKRIEKYEKRFRSVFFSTHTDLSKCSNEAGCRLQELILKMKQNTGKRFTLGYISSTCVRPFNGFAIKTGRRGSCFITSQSPVRFGNWASTVAFLLSPTSWNRSPRTSDASKPVNAANWIFSRFATRLCKPERRLCHCENPSRLSSDQQTHHVQSHWNLFTSSFWCSLEQVATTPACIYMHWVAAVSLANWLCVFLYLRYATVKYKLYLQRPMLFMCNSKFSQDATFDHFNLLRLVCFFSELIRYWCHWTTDYTETLHYLHFFTHRWWLRNSKRNSWAWRGRVRRWRNFILSFW